MSVFRSSPDLVHLLHFEMTHSRRFENSAISNAAFLFSWKKSSLGRMGKPEELANATVFLCSERANYISGVSLNLDGGRLKGLW